MTVLTRDIDYPDSDGEPVADNNLQFQWIMTIQGGLDALFADRLDVFVAGDMLWYPVHGDNQIRATPDVLVAFGRPKGYRGSYKQWEEDNTAPYVVFEILSPGNRTGEMARKFSFYDIYGVEEYYIYNPETFDFSAWIRQEGQLRLAEYDNEWISPLLGVRFVLRPNQDALVILGPDGRPFPTFVELDKQRQNAERLAESEKQRAENAEERAESAEERADRAEQERDKLAAQLRKMGIDPDTLAE